MHRAAGAAVRVRRPGTTILAGVRSGRLCQHLDAPFGAPSQPHQSLKQPLAVPLQDATDAVLIHEQGAYPQWDDCVAAEDMPEYRVVCLRDARDPLEALKVLLESLGPELLQTDEADDGAEVPVRQQADIE